MPGIGFHTDAFNSRCWNFDQSLAWAKEHRVKYIECGAIGGVNYMHGLGFSPHVALWEDPILLRRKMEGFGVQFSQLDAAFPISRPEGETIGVQYMLESIRYANLVGSPCIDTTDAAALPEGLTDKTVLELVKRIYAKVIPVAEAHGIIVNMEPHGYVTTNPTFVAEILDTFQSPNFCINMDTGNTFIAGRDPVEYLTQFKDRISHCHIKDVSKELAEALRGGATGIAMSHCAVGDGVNADNIRKCVQILLDNGYDGVFSLECEGALLEESLAWTRELLGVS